MPSEKPGTSWLATGFQVGIVPGISVGIIPVYFVHGWSAVWVWFLVFAVYLLIPASVVLGDRRNRRRGMPFLKKAEVNSFLVGILLGAIVAAAVVSLEFFVIHGAVIVGALLLVGYKGYRAIRLVRGLL